jgi:hypothetical protein
MIPADAAEGEALAKSRTAPKDTESDDRQDAHGGPTHRHLTRSAVPDQPNVATAAVAT